jgi:hypothetical protein
MAMFECTLLINGWDGIYLNENVGSINYHT